MASAESVRSLEEAKVGRPLSAAFYFTGIGGGVGCRRSEAGRQGRVSCPQECASLESPTPMA